MNFDDALSNYRKGTFTDHDVTRSTDLSVRAWRELIKTRAVHTITDNRGPGRVRLCDATVFKRAAAIGALNRAGFSLPVSGRIAYFLPFHTLLFSICDPCTILLPRSANVEPEPGLPPQIEQPKADWFDPDKPAKANSETDWLIEIYERRFVGFIYSAKEEPWIFGDLRNEGTSFVAWFPFRRRGQFMGSAIAELTKELLPNRFVDFVAQWEDPQQVTKELGLLDYKYERHDADHDPLCLTAEATARSPLFKTTVNVTLTITKALRRYLGIEPEVLDSEMAEPHDG
jgi:hypothetical protein